jgi:hypothetical protein
VARSQERVRLESGLRLSLPNLMRDGFLKRGERALPRLLRWTWTYTDEEFASLILTGSLESERHGWIRLKADWIDQHIELRGKSRHFGGCQFYFHCAYTGEDVSVLWRPPGATQFAARQRWGRRVAYGSQFQTPFDRALSQARKIRARIGGPGWESLVDPFPPKPKGMRWATYDRIAQRCEGYEATADARLVGFMGRLLGR